MKYERKIIPVVGTIVLLFSVMLPLSGCGKSSTVTPSSTVKPSSTVSQSSALSQSSGNVSVKNADGSVSISVPSGWNTNDTALYPGAIIGVANVTNSEYIVVTKKPKSEIGANSTVNDYMTLVKSVFNSILTNPVWGQTSNVTIGGCSGLTAQLSGTKKSDNSNVVYFVNALASKNYYYNVCGWTDSSKANANKTTIENIIKSFKETD